MGELNVKVNMEHICDYDSLSVFFLFLDLKFQSVCTINRDEEEGYFSKN